MEKYNAVVVGCGSIGALKDDKYDSPEDDSKILTMAHAFYTYENIDLIGVVDIDTYKAARAAVKWKTYSYRYISQIKDNIDIVAVCIDTEYHFDYLKSLLQIKGLQTVIVEKPFCETLYQAKTIIKMYEDEGINLIVNYSRRFELNIKHYKELFEANTFGKIYSCRISYTRGLLRDGCHAIDLCSYFFGKFKWARVLNTGKINDYNLTDPTVNLIMSFDRCENIFMNAVDGRNYAVFEFDMITEKGQIVFKDYFKRVYVYDVVPEPVYGDYNTLGSDYRVTDTELHTMLVDVVHSAYSQLAYGIEPPCTGYDALLTHKILNTLEYERRKIYGDSF